MTTYAIGTIGLPAWATGLSDIDGKGPAPVTITGLAGGAGTISIDAALAMTYDDGGVTSGHPESGTAILADIDVTATDGARVQVPSTVTVNMETASEPTVITQDSPPVLAIPTAGDTARSAYDAGTPGTYSASNGQTTTISAIQMRSGGGDVADSYILPEGAGLAVRETVTTPDGASEVFESAAVTVQPVPNDPPVAAADTATVAAGGTVQIDVLANDSDPDGDALSVTEATASPAGTVTIGPAPNYRLTYDATGVPAGTAVTIFYTVSDGEATDDGTVTVSVQAPAAPEDNPIPVSTSGVSDQTATFGSFNFADTGTYQIVGDDGWRVSNASVTSATGSGTEVTPDGRVRLNGEAFTPGDIEITCDQGTATITQAQIAGDFYLRSLERDVKALAFISAFNPPGSVRPVEDHQALVRSVGRRGRPTSELVDARAEAEAGTTPGLTISLGKVALTSDFSGDFSGYLLREVLDVKGGWSGRIHDCAWEILPGGPGIGPAIEVEYAENAHVDVEDCDFLAPDKEPSYGNGIIGQNYARDSTGEWAMSSIDVRRCYVKSSSGDPIKMAGASLYRRQICEYTYFGPNALLPGPWLGSYDNTRGYVTDEHVTNDGGPGIYRARKTVPPGIAPPMDGTGAGTEYWESSDPHADGASIYVSIGGTIFRGNVVNCGIELFPGQGVKPNNAIRVVQNNSGDVSFDPGDDGLPMRGVIALWCILPRGRGPTNAPPVDVVTPFDNVDGVKTDNLDPKWANTCEDSWIDPRATFPEDETSNMGAFFGSWTAEGGARDNVAFLGNFNGATGAALSESDKRAPVTDPIELWDRYDTEDAIFLRFNRPPVISGTGLAVAHNKLVIDKSQVASIPAGTIADADGNTYGVEITHDAPDDGGGDHGPGPDPTVTVYEPAADGFTVQSLAPVSDVTLIPTAEGFTVNAA